MAVRFHPAIVALASALVLSPAFANDALSPLTGNTSAPSAWRFAPGQLFNGVAVLDNTASLTFTTSAGTYACSGTLLQGGQYVLTAGHCATGFSSMTVEFQYFNGSAGITRTVAPADATLHPLWTGVWADDADRGTDMAILKLSAPVALPGVALSTTNDIGKTMLVAGYGTSTNGSTGTAPNWNDGNYGHYGYNVADVDSKTFNFAGDQAVGWGYDAAHYVATTYMFDFDNANGSANNNTLGRIAGVTGNLWASGTGLGAQEALIAGGDSGGGDFVWTGTEWQLSGVHSWGWQAGGTTGACAYFSLTGCDVSTVNSSSYGDLSGSTAVFDHVQWISSVTGIAAVPEPGTWAMLLAGMAAVAGARRRRAD